MDKKKEAFLEVYNLQKAVSVASALTEYPEPVRMFVWRREVDEKLKKVNPSAAGERLIAVEALLSSLGLIKDFKRWADKEPLPAAPPKWNLVSNATKQKLIIAATDEAHADVA